MKVVPFERSAAYLHHRAMKNRRSMNTVDALELLRHAVESNPDNREYKLDLAEMYFEMGCHVQSNRLLLDMLAQDDTVSECRYGLALNRIGMRDFRGAKRALEQYRGTMRDDENADEVRQLTMQIDFELFFRYMSENRKAQRGIQMREAAYAHVSAEEWEQANALYARSFACYSKIEAESVAWYALTLQKLHRDAEAVEKVRSVMRKEKSELSCTTLRVCGKVLLGAGCADEGRGLLRQAAEQHPFGEEAKDLVCAMREAGMTAEADECARLALQDTPFDRQLLHMRAVNALESGDGRAAKQYYVRILRIDPSDTVAEYYCDAIEHKTLDAEALSYSYEVPKAEYSRRLEIIAGYLRDVRNDAHTAEILWHTEPNFRKLMQWGLTCDENILSACVRCLAMIRDAEAIGIVRELCNRSDCPIKVRAIALKQYKAYGVDAHEIFPLKNELRDALLPNGEQMLHELFVGYRQVVRYAADMIAEETDEDAALALTLMWRVYRARRGTKCDALLTTEGAAAALYVCYMEKRGKAPNISDAAKHFGCTERQLKYYVRIMQSALHEGEKKNEAD